LQDVAGDLAAPGIAEEAPELANVMLGQVGALKTFLTACILSNRLFDCRSSASRCYMPYSQTTLHEHAGDFDSSSAHGDAAFILNHAWTLHITSVLAI
jgi:hypothetical protein